MHVLFAAAVFLSVGQTDAPVAMVLVVKGNAVFRRADEPAGKAKQLESVVLLRAGDRIDVPDGGEVTMLFLESGDRQRIKPKRVVAVGAKGCDPADAVEIIPAKKPASLDSIRDHIRSNRGAVGVLRGDPPSAPQLVTPLFGATILSDRPTFTWKDAKAEAYQVELLTGSQSRDQRRLWIATVKEPRLSYPAKEPPLPFGKLYRWRVTPLKGGEPAETAIVESKFLTLTRGEIDLLSGLAPLKASTDPTDLALAAVSYEAHGVYDEALGAYEELARRVPTDANLQITLGNYYDRAGAKDLADAARARAKKNER